MATIEKKGSSKSAQGTQSGKGKDKAKLSLRDRAVRDLEHFASRVTTFAKRFRRLPAEMQIKETFENVSKTISACAVPVKALAADWTPVKGVGGGSSMLGIGDLVQLREKVAAKYDGLLPPATNLTVKDVRKAIVAVQTPDGARVFLPRGHLILASAVKPATKS
jgi:hypothetical protein